jgi:hypothetical protein
VASWAARRGVHPVPAPAGAQFDHVFTVGRNLLRIQTRTTAGPGRDGQYHVRMTRGNSGDPHGTCRYAHVAYDIVALVFLDRGIHPAHAAQNWEPVLCKKIYDHVRVEWVE